MASTDRYDLSVSIALEPFRLSRNRFFPLSSGQQQTNRRASLLRCPTSHTPHSAVIVICCRFAIRWLMCTNHSQPLVGFLFRSSSSANHPIFFALPCHLAKLSSSLTFISHCCFLFTTTNTSDYSTSTSTTRFSTLTMRTTNLDNLRRRRQNNGTVPQDPEFSGHRNPNVCIDIEAIIGRSLSTSLSPTSLSPTSLSPTAVSPSGATEPRYFPAVMESSMPTTAFLPGSREVNHIDPETGIIKFRHYPLAGMMDEFTARFAEQDKKFTEQDKKIADLKWLCTFFFYIVAILGAVYILYPVADPFPGAREFCGNGLGIIAELFFFHLLEKTCCHLIHYLHKKITDLNHFKWPIRIILFIATTLGAVWILYTIASPFLTVRAFCAKGLVIIIKLFIVRKLKELVDSR